MLGIKDKTQKLINERIGPLGKFGKYLFTGMALAILLISLFGKLAEDLIYQELTVFDSVISKFIAGFNTPETTQFMKLITTLGSTKILIPATFLAIFMLNNRKKNKWDSIMMLVALGGGLLLNQLLKWVFQRPRPSIARLVEVGGYSFPSGHAMVSIAFYGFLAYLFWSNIRRTNLRYLVTFSMAILIALIGISRIYLGVHYPSDVLAGFAAGGFWLTSCILTLEAIRNYKSRSTQS